MDSGERPRAGAVMVLAVDEHGGHAHDVGRHGVELRVVPDEPAVGGTDAEVVERNLKRLGMGLLDAVEAYRIGLCERLVDEADLEKVVEDLATTLAAQPPLAVAGAKAALNRAAHGESREAVLRETAERQAVCLRSKDFAEAITAFLEQRPPEYRGE